MLLQSINITWKRFEVIIQLLFIIFLCRSLTISDLSPTLSPTWCLFHFQIVVIINNIQSIRFAEYILLCNMALFDEFIYFKKLSFICFTLGMKLSGSCSCICYGNTIAINNIRLLPQCMHPHLIA